MTARVRVYILRTASTALYLIYRVDCTANDLRNANLNKRDENRVCDY